MYDMKKYFLMLTILLSFFMIVGFVSACENISDASSLETSNLSIEDASYSNEISQIKKSFDENYNSQEGLEEAPLGESDENNDSGSNSTDIVENTTVIDNLSAPYLSKVQYYPNGNNFYAKFVWYSNNGSTYQVLRKSTEDFEVISTVTANSQTTTFYDKIAGNDSYTYSVREIVQNDEELILGNYDAEGLKLLSCPEVAVDFQNIIANVTWTKIDNADNYRIFRKMGRAGTFKCIAVVDANQTSYTDIYYESADELSSIMNSRILIDPSFNSLFYTVRACSIDEVDGINKTSYGLYLVDGDFYLESPSIVSLADNCIKWGKVPNADGYMALRYNGTDWEVIGNAKQKTTTVISMELDSIDKNAYYSIMAYALKNGEMVYSDFDTGFSLMNYSDSYSNQRILYFGDSITYGSPYKSLSSRHIFSYPHRVAQLLGCVFYNPSIPGSTYHDLGQIDGKNIEKTGYYRYRICREVVDQIANGELPGNWEDLDTSRNSENVSNTRIDDYNIVVLAAGTNDYRDESELGPLDSDDVKTFHGALNHIIGQIENASKIRVDRGQSPIKLIFIDLFYSDYTYDHKIRENRDITPNGIGLTLMDYQDALNEQYAKWQESEYLEFYNFKTRDYDIVNEENCPYTASDNLHYTKFTYGQYGNAFARFLVENVFKSQAILTADNLNMTYNDGTVWAVNLTDEYGNPISNETVSIGINGQNYDYASDDEGIVKFPIELPAGNYTINATFKGNALYYSAFTNATVTVDKADVNLSTDNLVMEYKDGSGWTVCLSDANGNAVNNARIYIAIKGKAYAVRTNSSGIAKLPINLAPGVYDINATFSETDCYTGAFTNATVTVNKATANLSADNLVMRYKDGNGWTVRLNDTNGNAITNTKININIKGKTYAIKTNSTGIAKLTINFAPGVYDINATFSETDCYTGAFTNATVTVNKATANLSADNLVMRYKDGNGWTVRLNDTNGNAITNTKININIKGKTYAIKTNSSGIAMLPINFAVGVYNISASLSNSYYEAEPVYANVTVKKPVPVLVAEDLVMTYRDGSVFSANLTDKNSNAITNSYVKITIGNKTYNRKTNDEGIATLPINLACGNYTVAVGFDGNNKFDSVEIISAITVNRP